jgi:prepilin-type processing-associated H-X9-DG protein
MDENYAGYVLNALDPETQRRVEDYLRDHPEGRRQVELLRQALEPLAADREEIEPPPGLAVRTLACVAEYCCRDLPRVPAALRRPEAPPPRWWRRADVLVAACLLLSVGLLIPPVIGYLHQQQQLESCKNNLHQFGDALLHYSQLHRNAFPNVADLKPRDVAGMVVPVLVRDGLIRPEYVSIRCPGNGGPVFGPWTVDQLKALSDEEFQQLAPRLAGCYAYTLGYQFQGRVQGYARDRGSIPLMADRPPRSGDGDVSGDNSPNHGGRGQNVLFSDGHVAFVTNRTIGGDDIYLNRNHRVGAGLDDEDVVLGVSEARP